MTNYLHSMGNKTVKQPMPNGGPTEELLTLRADLSSAKAENAFLEYQVKSRDNEIIFLEQAIDGLTAERRFYCAQYYAQLEKELSHLKRNPG